MDKLKPETKRYKRLSPAERAEAVARWRAGAETLEELSAAFGVSCRSLQYTFAKEGAEKGAAISEDARRIERAVIEEAFGSDGDRIEQGRAARRQTLDLTTRLERATASIIVEIENNPAAASAHAGGLRSIGMAMQILERGFSIKTAALNLSRDDLDPEELPQIIIRDLGEEELAAMRVKHGDADD